MRDRDSFERLVLVHLDAAYNLARWLTRNDADASDVVQEACLHAYAGFGGLRGDDARPWFLAIVRHDAYAWMTRHRRRDAVDLAELEETHRAPPDPSPGPEETLLRRLDDDAVRAAIEQLPAPFREVIVLRELEEMGYREIADVIGVPIGTVMSRLSRARARLAGDLARAANEVPR